MGRSRVSYWKMEQNKMKIKTHNPYILLKNQDIFNNTQQRLSDKTIVIPHVCNNINVFGGGFTKYINDNYPIVAENFYMLGNKAKLGHTQFIEVANKNNNKLVFCNMIAQNDVVSQANPRPLNYYALSVCMFNIKLHIQHIIKSNDSSVEIHAPKFGSGLAGGNWLFISDLIKDIWNNIPVFIYQK